MHDNPLFRAMLENPTDIELRLVFSDWLDDHDESARAEFVRLQCRNAEPIEFEQPQRDKLPSYCTQREHQLFGLHRREWNVPLFRFLASSQMSKLIRTQRSRKISEWSVRRGFVEHLAVDAQTLVQFAETLFQLGPILHLRIRNTTAPLREILTLSQLTQIRTLRLPDLLRPFEIRELRHCPYLENLTELTVDANPCGTEEELFAELTETRHLKSLKRDHQHQRSYLR